MRRLHHIGLEAHDERIGVVERAGRLQPLPVFGEHFGRKGRQHVMRLQELTFLLDDALDGEIADIELQAHFETSADYAAGGTDIFTDGRSSIFLLNASSFG